MSTGCEAGRDRVKEGGREEGREGGRKGGRKVGGRKGGEREMFLLSFHRCRLAVQCAYSALSQHSQDP